MIYLFIDVLITGICDSGKTTILSQLVSGKTGQTYTSMNHNRFSLPVENKAAVELVDVPGSDRVRGQVRDGSPQKNYEDSEHGPICGRGGSRISLKKNIYL